MIALYLLAAHMVGDFVLQTRWQAEAKLSESSARLRHVATYCLPFVPVAFVYGQVGPLDRWSAGMIFIGWLALLHFLTDSVRFRSTLGDVVGWYYRTHEQRLVELRESFASTIGKTSDSVPPNPWPPMPILIDQTLHVCQLALLGGLLLR